MESEKDNNTINSGSGGGGGGGGDFEDISKVNHQDVSSFPLPFKKKRLN